MTSVALGLLASLAAATLFASGLILQAGEARTQPIGGHLGLVRSLTRRPRWLAGTALTLAGWPLQALALLLAPLTLVQPTVVTGVLVVLVVAERRSGGRPGIAPVAGVGALVVGLAALTFVSPARSAVGAPDAAGVVALLVLGGGALAPLVVRAPRRRSGPMLALAAGAAYGWTALATKLGVDALAGGAPLVALAWVVTIVGAEALAVGHEMGALQARRTSQVAPLVLVAELLVPILLAPVLAKEPWTHGADDAAVFVLGLGLVTGGAVVLARGGPSSPSPVGKPGLTPPPRVPLAPGAPGRRE